MIRHKIPAYSLLSSTKPSQQQQPRLIPLSGVATWIKLRHTKPSQQKEQKEKMTK
jgi:hypothetical protein